MADQNLLAMLQKLASDNAGDPKWKPFFSLLHRLSREGLGAVHPEDGYLWRDDGTRRHLVQKDSLLHFCSNAWSQRGDDGIVRRIFALLGIEQGFFIEFGAWDGIYLSNSRALSLRGWHGCFIEADRAKFEQLAQTYLQQSSISCVNAFVVPSPSPEGMTLDAIAATHFPGREVDFLSIDIDGLDLLILESLELRPKVICIEGGFSWHPRYTQRVPDQIASQNLQQPLAVVIEAATRKRYTPVCFNQNTYLVADEYASPFQSIIKDPVTLWRDAWFNETETFRRNQVKFRGNPLIRTQEGPNFEQLDF